MPRYCPICHSILLERVPYQWFCRICGWAGIVEDTRPLPRPSVGVGVAVRQNGLVLLGLRTCKHANGLWGFPGGHLEGGESFEDCAIRETEEETGIRLTSAKLWTVVNTIYLREGKHYVVPLMVAGCQNQTARNMEPDKCENWSWFQWDNLPRPLMPGIEDVVNQGLTPFGV